MRRLDYLQINDYEFHVSEAPDGIEALTITKDGILVQGEELNKLSETLNYKPSPYEDNDE